MLCPRRSVCMHVDTLVSVLRQGVQEWRVQAWTAGDALSILDMLLVYPTYPAFLHVCVK